MKNKRTKRFTISNKEKFQRNKKEIVFIPKYKSIYDELFKWER